MRNELFILGMLIKVINPSDYDYLLLKFWKYHKNQYTSELMRYWHFDFLFLEIEGCQRQMVNSVERLHTIFITQRKHLSPMRRMVLAQNIIYTRWGITQCHKLNWTKDQTNGLLLTNYQIHQATKSMSFFNWNASSMGAQALETVPQIASDSVIICSKT